MRFEQLRYLEAALRFGSIRQAADQLGVTQPSVSQQIVRLEEDLGVILMVRRPNGVQPTDAATAILPHVRVALRMEEQMRQEAGAISGGRTGRVRIGTVATPTTTILPHVVERFQHQFQGLHIEIMESNTPAIADMVASGRIDLGLVGRLEGSKERHPELHYEDLESYRLTLCVPVQHRLSTRPTVTGKDLEGEPLIGLQDGYVTGQAYERLLGEGRSLQMVCYSDNNLTVRWMVAAGVGLALSPDLRTLDEGSLWHGKLEFIPFEEPWMSCVISVVRRDDEQPTPAVNAFIRTLRQHAQAQSS